jgi:glutathione synthase/RimK-type ligase-like ATP-grasp enzyme
MKIAIHYHEDAHKDSFSRKWIEEYQKRDIDVLAIDFRCSDIIEKIRHCDGAMWHWFHMPDDKQAAPKILEAIEAGFKIPVFPNLATRWHYDDKLAQHYFFDAIKAPKIRSWVFWNYNEALDFIKQCSYPIIFKLSVGAGSSNVLMLKSLKEAEDILDKMFVKGFFPYTVNEFASKEKIVVKGGVKSRFKNVFKALLKPEIIQTIEIPWYYLVQKNYVYFQEFMPNNTHDIRITVIGSRAFGYIRYNRANDFRASGSGNFDVNPKNIPLEAVKIAHQISKSQGFQSMAYDFLCDVKGKVLVNEISYCYVNWMVHNCPGYWDRDLNWHEGNIWPEEAQVEDFIYYIETGKLI